MKEKLRFMAVCAHPDDMELRMGGTMLKLTRTGHNVRIVCLTDGSAGHYDMPPRQLAERRRKEAEHVARYAGLSAYEIWDVPDGCLEVNLTNRERLIGRIREFAPDVLFTFRACDYHPDHRAAAQLAQDASYLVAAPMYLPHYPTPKRAPVILMTHDEFTSPNVFSPTVAVAIDDVIDDKVEMMACHESQFFEWLAYDRFSLANVPPDHAGRLKWLKEEWIGRDRRQAEKFKTLLNERYGSKAEDCVFAETYELSEYGRIPKQGELHELLPE
jgi:LmbE family N-acetylglucosaminyl deacetylase